MDKKRIEFMKKINVSTLNKSSLAGVDTEYLSLFPDGMKLAKAKIIKGVIKNVAQGEIRDLPVGQNCLLYIKSSSNFSAVFLLTYRSAILIAADSPLYWKVAETSEDTTAQNNIIKPKTSNFPAKLKNGAPVPVVLNYEYVIIPVGGF